MRPDPRVFALATSRRTLLKPFIPWLISWYSSTFSKGLSMSSESLQNSLSDWELEISELWRESRSNVLNGRKVLASRAYLQYNQQSSTMSLREK